MGAVHFSSLSPLGTPCCSIIESKNHPHTSIQHGETGYFACGDPRTYSQVCYGEKTAAYQSCYNDCKRNYDVARTDCMNICTTLAMKREYFLTKSNLNLNANTQ